MPEHTSLLPTADSSTATSTAHVRVIVSSDVSKVRARLASGPLSALVVIASRSSEKTAIRIAESSCSSRSAEPTSGAAGSAGSATMSARCR